MYMRSTDVRGGGGGGETQKKTSVKRVNLERWGWAITINATV